MAFYKKQFNEKNQVYYPHAITVGKPVGTKEIADRLAKISTVSRADTYAVLMELGGVLADIMKEGKSAYLEGLGHFRYALDTDGVANEADFDAQKQIKAVRVRFTPEREGAATRGGTQTRALVPGNVEWHEWAGKAEGTSADGGEDTEEPDEDQTENPLA